jgi:hypothetical protein
MYVGLVAGRTGTNVAGYLFLGRQYLFPIVRKDPFSDLRKRPLALNCG